MRTYPTFIANDDRRPLAFANGQFLLIERSAYDAAGGHEAVRDRFVEDIDLARKVKALGRSIRTAIAPEISSTRMYTSLPSLVRGWSRILYDAHDRRALPLVGKIVEPLIFSQTGRRGPDRRARPAGPRPGRAVRLVAAGAERGASGAQAIGPLSDVRGSTRRGRPPMRGSTRWRGSSPT